MDVIKVKITFFPPATHTYIWISKEKVRRRQWHPTPVFLPGETQGWGSLVGCCLWGHTESDITEVT